MGWDLFATELAGHGVVYPHVRKSIQSVEWTSQAKNHTYELLWVHVSGSFIGALYHMPVPKYSRDDLLRL